MPQITLHNAGGEALETIELDEAVFGAEVREDLVHAAVVAQLAAKRAGTHKAKTRGEVSGGGRKPYRQKGTGRARQGDRRAPHWTGGGVVFGPHPRSYHQDVPRKMRRVAMKSALSARVAEAALTVVDELALAAPKTREVRGLLEALGLTRGALIVTAERDDVVCRASRNLEDVRAVTPGGLNLLDVLKYRHLVLTRSAVQALTKQLTTEISRGRQVAAGEDGGTTAGAAGAMDRTAEAEAEAGAPADVALADAAEAVASPGAVEADAGASSGAAAAASDDDTKEGA